MADYHSPTVVTPELPVCDVTPLERLILGRVFDVPGQHDGLLYFADAIGPDEFFEVHAGNLQAALNDSTAFESRLNDLARTLLAAREMETPDGPPPGGCGEFMLDLTASEIDWTHILQDIVRRSDSLDEVVVWTAFTCTKMRQDGFGGCVVRITGDAVQSASTFQMLEAMRERPNPPATDTADGHGTRRRLEAIAGAAGWDSFTLVLLIARWLNANGHTETLVEHLDQLAGANAG